MCLINLLPARGAETEVRRTVVRQMDETTGKSDPTISYCWTLVCSEKYRWRNVSFWQPWWLRIIRTLQSRCPPGCTGTTWTAWLKNWREWIGCSLMLSTSVWCDRYQSQPVVCSHSSTWLQQLRGPRYYQTVDKLANTSVVMRASFHCHQPPFAEELLYHSWETTIAERPANPFGTPSSVGSGLSQFNRPASPLTVGWRIIQLGEIHL